MTNPAPEIGVPLPPFRLALHPDDPGPTPPVDELDDDPDATAGVCSRCGTPLELDGCSSTGVRLRRSGP